uniref:Uncharacterized protein n=1 Tax=Caenorhabditis japonica TaxID=281687 RepID=A0A8R1EK74_CAEJA
MASLAVKRVNLVSRCLKRFPELSLSCQINASFSLNTPKSVETAGTEQHLEKQERCRKIVSIEHEIEILKRHLENRRKY